MEKTIKTEQNKNHSVCIENRATVSMTGISEVISSCETELCLVSSLGEMTLLGKNFKITEFNADTGNLFASGTIDTIKYKGAKTSVLKRIFK